MLEGIAVGIAIYIYFTIALMKADDEDSKGLFFFALAISWLILIFGWFNKDSRGWILSAFKWMLWPFGEIKHGPFAGLGRKKQQPMLDKNGNATALTEEQMPTRIVAETIASTLLENFLQIKRKNGDEYHYMDEHYNIVNWAGSKTIFLKLYVDGVNWEDTFDDGERKIIGEAFVKAKDAKQKLEAEQELLRVKKLQAEGEAVRQMAGIDHIERRLFPERAKAPMLEHQEDDTTPLPQDEAIDRLLKELQEEKKDILSV